MPGPSSVDRALAPAETLAADLERVIAALRGRMPEADQATKEFHLTLQRASGMVLSGWQKWSRTRGGSC